MGRGIAVAFAYAGYKAMIVDLKERKPTAFAALAAEALQEIRTTFSVLARLGLFEESDVDQLVTRVAIVPEHEAHPALSAASVMFEALPESVDMKRDALARISAQADAEVIIASTTSTIMVDEIATAVKCPARFLNATGSIPLFSCP
jgi:3-hydroxybutyryl-CoA dehydrogenase